MKVLASWLNEYLSTKVDAKTAAERLTAAGIEIEQIIGSIKLDRKIVVAQVNKVIQHPNADRLKVVEVDMGTGVVQVVCGGPNVASRQNVALALPGAKLPDGKIIEKALIRGENSEGMICSAFELGLGDDHEGIMVLDSGLTLGATLCDIVDFGDILDLTTAANRSDLLCTVGLAREVAAQGGEVALEPIIEAKEFKVNEGMIGELDGGQVKKYVLTHVKLNKNGDSPQWMQQRLRAAGLRPINTVVDITNYVMLELGQPLHAFDSRKVTLPISAHSPGENTNLTILDGSIRGLSPNDLVIFDKNGPIALAGLMGGKLSEITSTTKEIYLESACFDGTKVRKMAVRQGLRTDASSRFERNLPLPLVALGMRRAIELLEELCDAQITAISSVEPPLSPAGTLEVSLDRINARLGINVTQQQAVLALSNLGFEINGSDQRFNLSIPWWRTDVLDEADIVEELGRSIGYDALPPTLPTWTPTKVDFDEYWPKLWRLKALLRGLGLDEVVTYSFVSEKQLDDFNHDKQSHLKLKNPLSVEQAYLRSSLAPSLVATVARNARNFPSFGIYEISKVYLATDDHTQQPAEPMRLGVAWRIDNPYAKVKSVVDTLSRDFAQFKVKPNENSIFTHGKSAQILLDNQPIGWIGEINKAILKSNKITSDVGYLEIDLMPWLTQPNSKKATPISRFPAITRDLSIIVSSDKLWSDINEIVQNANVGKVEYLNEYYGLDLEKGTKSVSMRLTFSSLERTLADGEADAATVKAMDALSQELGAIQRG